MSLNGRHPQEDMVRSEQSEKNKKREGKQDKTGQEEFRSVSDE